MDLREYIDTYGIKVNFLAKQIGISATALHNHLHGTIPRLDRALKIEELTHGLVKANAEDWNLKGKRTTKKAADNSKTIKKPTRGQKTQHKHPVKPKKEEKHLSRSRKPESQDGS